MLVEMPHTFNYAARWSVSIYILLDILVCSIAVYFYESCSILASPKGESKYKLHDPTFSFPHNSDLPRFLIFCAVGGMRRVQISCDLYSFRALFVLYEAVLDNKCIYHVTTSILRENTPGV